MSHNDLRDKVARAIFEHWQFQGRMAGTMAGVNPVLWVSGGNSFKQDEARDYADAALAVIREALAKPTPMMQAAAWRAWHSRQGGKLAPGPAFTEALNAMLAASPLYPEK